MAQGPIGRPTPGTTCPQHGMTSAKGRKLDEYAARIWFTDRADRVRPCDDVERPSGQRHADRGDGLFQTHECEIAGIGVEYRGSRRRRNGAFSVSCGTATCTIATLEGAVTVTNSQGTVEIAAGSQTVVAAGGAPSPPRPLDGQADAQQAQWLACNTRRDAISLPSASLATADATACTASLGSATALPPKVGGSPTPSAPPSSSAPATVAPTTPPPAPTAAPRRRSRPGLRRSREQVTLPPRSSRTPSSAPARGRARSDVHRVGAGRITLVGVGPRGGPTTAKGTSSAGGTTGFSPWQCNTSQAGQVWTFTLTGGSGHSVTYDLVLTA